jgi:hypothetical protein
MCLEEPVHAHVAHVCGGHVAALHCGGIELERAAGRMVRTLAIHPYELS